ncbi:Tudor/PWWP/MBT superfamily protein [Zea mays]|uniref:Tudor/PWWP/MBT superfamily protein n=1 Tax=Zea mays TaxID=4577 RepID=A0A1D6J2A1_MAIZE|nr:Tudor/PWWP/MBT superfamily protein [Zea mays]
MGWREARPLKGGLRKTPEHATPPAGRRRGARLMEKIVPGASAMKAKSSKKDQYLLKRRDAPAHRQRQLPDDGPPGFPSSGDPPTPPLPGSSVADEDFMLQRRAPLVEVPPAALAQPTEMPAAPKPRKRQPEEGADASPDAAGGDPKRNKKKKKLSDVDGAGAGKASVVQDPIWLDLTQVLSDLRNLPLVPFHGADRRISDTTRSFVLAFRSKYYKKSYENDPPEESKKGLGKPSAAAADGHWPKKKKPAPRPGAGKGNDPTIAGVKRGPSDRQGDLAVRKKAKLDKIKTLPSEKKAAGLEQKDTAVAAVAKDKAEVAAAKRKEPAPAPAPAPSVRTLSPTALQMKFPLKSTLPSVALLKARFARFGPLDVDGIRVYWKSHMCRVVYRFKSDAEAAFRYAQANAMFGQVDTQYHLREVEAPEAPPQQRSELRLMETAPFRPGSSGNGAPLPMSRAGAVPAAAARPPVGQLPKSILKKSTDEGNSGTAREVSRVTFMLDGGAPMVVKAAKSVGFASSQPPPRPLLQQPMRPNQPRPSGFPGGQQQVGYPPRSGDSPPQQFPPRPSGGAEIPAWKMGEREFKEEVWRLMTGIAKLVEPLTDKNGFFPYHLFRAQ